MKSGEHAIWQASLERIAHRNGFGRSVDLSPVALSLFRAWRLAHLLTEPVEINLTFTRGDR